MIQNGYTITVCGGPEPLIYVYQMADDEDPEPLADVLRRIVADIGPADSRYSRARIHIEVRPGDKHADGSCPSL